MQRGNFQEGGGNGVSTSSRKSHQLEHMVKISLRNYLKGFNSVFQGHPEKNGFSLIKKILKGAPAASLWYQFSQQMCETKSPKGPESCCLKEGE